MTGDSNLKSNERKDIHRHSGEAGGVIPSDTNKTKVQILLIEDSIADAVIFQEYLADSPEPDQYRLVHLKRLSKAGKVIRRHKFDVIKESDRLILVEGHTDSTPVAGSMFYDNWDLSALRATSMTKVLIEEFNVNPRILTASGYAQYKPIAPNTTDFGRAQNRRVDIVMLNAQRASELLAKEPIPGLE